MLSIPRCWIQESLLLNVISNDTVLGFLVMFYSTCMSNGLATRIAIAFTALSWIIMPSHIA